MWREKECPPSPQFRCPSSKWMPKISVFHNGSRLTASASEHLIQASFGLYRDVNSLFKWKGRAKNILFHTFLFCPFNAIFVQYKSCWILARWIYTHLYLITDYWIIFHKKCPWKRKLCFTEQAFGNMFLASKLMDGKNIDDIAQLSQPPA